MPKIKQIAVRRKDSPERVPERLKDVSLLKITYLQKSSKRKRHLRGVELVAKADVAAIKKLMPML